MTQEKHTRVLFHLITKIEPPELGGSLSLDRHNQPHLDPTGNKQGFETFRDNDYLQLDPTS